MKTVSQSRQDATVGVSQTISDVDAQNRLESQYENATKEKVRGIAERKAETYRAAAVRQISSAISSADRVFSKT